MSVNHIAFGHDAGMCMLDLSEVRYLSSEGRQLTLYWRSVEQPTKFSFNGVGGDEGIRSIEDALAVYWQLAPLTRHAKA